MNMKTVTFELGERAHEKVKSIADFEERTLAGQLRYIVDEWLEGNGNKARRKDD